MRLALALLLLLPPLAGAQSAGTRQLAVEVVSTDVVARSITVKQPARLVTTMNPPDTSIVSLAVDPAAAPGLATVGHGDEVTLTCRQTAVAQADTPPATGTPGPRTTPPPTSTPAPSPTSVTPSPIAPATPLGTPTLGPAPLAGVRGAAAVNLPAPNAAAADTSRALGATAAGSSAVSLPAPSGAAADTSSARGAAVGAAAAPFGAGTPIPLSATAADCAVVNITKTLAASPF